MNLVFVRSADRMPTVLHAWNPPLRDDADERRERPTPTAGMSLIDVVRSFFANVSPGHRSGAHHSWQELFFRSSSQMRDAMYGADDKGA
jgi:hypothetical protein